MPLVVHRRRRRRPRSVVNSRGDAAGRRDAELRGVGLRAERHRARRVLAVLADDADERLARWPRRRAHRAQEGAVRRAVEAVGGDARAQLLLRVVRRAHAPALGPAPAVISVPLVRSTQRTSSLTLASAAASAAAARQSSCAFRQRRRRAGGARQRHGDADVLDHQRQLERVVEAAADDALLDVRLRHPRHAGGDVQHVDHRLRVEPVALAHRQAFAQGEQVHRGDQVVEALHRMAGAEAADVEHRLAHRRSSGRTRSRSAAAPPTMNTSSAACAPHSAPETGASTMATPRSASASPSPRSARARTTRCRAAAHPARSPAAGPGRRRRASAPPRRSAPW